MAPGWAKDVYPDGLVHNPRNPDVMFMSAAEHNPARWRDNGVPGYSGSRMYRSTDGGESWEVLAGGLPDRMQQEVGGLAIEAWAGGSQVFAATSAGEVWWSEDGGDSWSCIARGLGAIAKKGHEMLLSNADLDSRSPFAAPGRSGSRIGANGTNLNLGDLAVDVHHCHRQDLCRVL